MGFSADKIQNGHTGVIKNTKSANFKELLVTDYNQIIGH